MANDAKLQKLTKITQKHIAGAIIDLARVESEPKPQKMMYASALRRRLEAALGHAHAIERHLAGKPEPT